MKRQHILLLSLVLLTYPPLCLAKKPKINSHRNNPTEDESVYLGNQAKTTTDFVEVTNNDATPSPSLATEAPKKESQYTPGRYYTELNKWVFRDVRGLAKETIAPFETEKGCDKALGTGDPEENAALFSKALKSHIKALKYKFNEQEFNDATHISRFSQEHQIKLSKDACEEATSFFKTHATTLQQEHVLLAPQLAKDKNIRVKLVTITAALERLKEINPEVKK